MLALFTKTNFKLVLNQLGVYIFYFIVHNYKLFLVNIIKILVAFFREKLREINANTPIVLFSKFSGRTKKLYQFLNAFFLPLTYQKKNSYDFNTNYKSDFKKAHCNIFQYFIFNYFYKINFDVSFMSLKKQQKHNLLINTLFIRAK